MSARGALDSYIESLQILARPGAGDRSEAERQADAEHRSKLIDGIAHEIAERQREHVRRRAAHPLHYGSADWAIRGVDEAADLIDPKAQRASTEGDTP